MNIKSIDVNEAYYIKICDLYKDMQDSLIPHINEEKTLYKFEINRIMQSALEITVSPAANSSKLSLQAIPWAANSSMSWGL